jgi:hypothetical protein
MEESKPNTWMLRERTVLLWEREKGLPALLGGRVSAPAEKEHSLFLVGFIPL